MKWIKLTEYDAPNKNDRVIVTDGKNTCYHYKQSIVCIDPVDDLYCLLKDQCEINPENITHWMPLPEIPEE